MGLHSLSLKGTTASDGTLTVDESFSISGLLYAIEWIVGMFDSGVDAVVSVQSTGSGNALTLLTLTDANSSGWYYPRTAAHGATGTALTATAGGDNVQIVLSGRLRLAVTGGGDAKTGGVIIYYTG